MIGLRFTVSDLNQADFSPDIEQFVDDVADAIPSAFRQLTDESIPTGRLYRRGIMKGRRTKALENLGLKVVSKTRLVIGSRIHRASAPGQMPAKDTRELYRKIRTLKQGRFRKTVKFDAPHAGYVENIRPFLDKTIIRAIENVAK